MQLFKQFVIWAGPASHVVGGFIIFFAWFIPLALLRVRQAHWIAAAMAIGFYWGRETRDHEGRLRRPAADVFHHSWMPWEWSTKSIIDLVLPTATALLLAILVEIWLRRRRRAG